MKRSIHGLLGFLSIIILFASCNKKELDEFYGKPANLAPPIYDQLQANGLTSMMAVIDKAGYRDILGKAGYWTVFAPSNEAFQQFAQQKGWSSINEIDKETATEIVRYNTLYNAYREDNISTFESPDRILVPGMSFRKKSTYYDFVYEENGKKYISANSNFGYYVDDNNNKYVPFFTEDFLSASGVTVQDYNSFFPGVTFSGFNVVDAKVTQTDIIAENGIVHAVDKVVLPLQNIDQYLSSKPEYSEFKKLLEENAFYATYYKLQTRYKALTGSDDSVFVKMYLNMAFAPGNENYANVFSSDAQANFWSIAVPTNTQLLAYKDQLLKDWGPELTPSMKKHLIDSHMWGRALWPSKLSTTLNSKGEKPTFNASNVIERKMLSNGNFYGINAVQEANVFRTVYSKPYLHRDYLLQTRGLNRAIVNQITDPNEKFGLIMQSDDQFLTTGYSFAELNNNYSYKNPSTGATIINDVARDRFLRILNMTTFDNSFLNLTDLTGKGVLKGNRGEGEIEEYLYYDNNKIYAAGNMDTNTPVTVTRVEQTVNGPVFFTSGSLNFSEKRLGIRIQELAAADPNSYQYFYEFLSKSSLWGGGSIVGVTLGSEYTVLIPTNQAIMEAVKRGELPGNTTTGVPTTAQSSNLLVRAQVERFLAYHFIEKETIAPDGDPDKQGRMTTLNKDLNASEPDTYVYITNALNSMQVMDAKGNNASLRLSASNKLADRALIHSIDRVLLDK